MKQITKFNFSKLLTLAMFLLVLFASGQQAKADVPNGDGDLLWERKLNGRTVNDAVFHPINGNIIAAVNNEIWEIDPKDGHTIRVFEGATGIGSFGYIGISSDGNYVIIANGGATPIKLFDYNSGKFVNDVALVPWSSVDFYPNSTKILFNQAKKLYIYDVLTNKLVKESESLSDNNSFMRFKLSKDGKYIAIGIAETSGTGYSYHMELWDAETLTPIRSFGSPGDISEFRDVQISNDDQYVGFLCGGPRSLYIFKNDNSQLIKAYENTSAFSFTPNTKVIIYSGTKPEDAQSNIISLPNLDTVYQYIWARSLFRFNENNEMYAGGSTLKLYSNHWYTVGVNEPAGTSLKIEQVNYTKNNLQIITNGIDIINSLIITDTLGKRIYQQNNIAITNNQAEIPLSLPSGNYLIKLTANGKELTGKFIVVN